LWNDKDNHGNSAPSLLLERYLSDSLKLEFFWVSGEATGDEYLRGLEYIVDVLERCQNESY
jgi:hypothetical protein